MFLFYFQSNTLTVLGRQMFVNYSKSQEIKRYSDVRLQINLHKHATSYRILLVIEKGVQIQLKLADVSESGVLQIREWCGNKK